MHQEEQIVAEVAEITTDSPEPQKLQILSTSSLPITYQNNPALEDGTEEVTNIPKNILGEGASLLNLLAAAPVVIKAINDLIAAYPELIELDDRMLKSKYGKYITVVIQRLRISLWQEYERAVTNNRLMKVSQIFAGICSNTYFQKMLENPQQLAYILHAPSDYKITLKEAHQAGLEKLREIFNAVVVDEDGNLNPKSADVVIKAFALIDARYKGSVIQRVDQRVMKTTVTPDTFAKTMGLTNDMNALELELEKARKEMAKYTAIPKHPTAERLVKDVESLEIDYKEVKDE